VLLSAALLTVGWDALPAAAEPTFLAMQYPRCTACHYSPSGGGLLTPYGRSLARAEISTFGRRDAAGPAGGGRAGEASGFSAFGGEGPFGLGLDVRPSHLAFEVPGREIPDRNLLMNLDLQAAWQAGRWTAYATVGRRPGGGLISYEHWITWQAADRVSVRGGRFLPAYGVRFADHTSFSRERLDLAQDDQIYGVEVGLSTDRALLQLAAGPGRAAAVLDSDGRARPTASGRFQFDLGPRTVVVGSLLHRGASERGSRSTSAGASFGYAPVPWLATWSQVDVRFQEAPGSDRTTILTNQTSIEAWRGIWFRVSPQVLRTAGDPRGEIRRMVYGVDLYPRTRWHVNVSWYRDRFVFANRRNTRLLAQLHLYL
jgi:hypothetical protein